MATPAPNPYSPAPPATAKTNAMKVFLTCVVPPIAVVVVVTVNYFSGAFTAGAPVALAMVWLFAATWGYGGWWLRRTRRSKARRETTSKT